MAVHRPVEKEGVASERGRKPVRRTLSSRELFGSHQELCIEHAGEEYRLRITSNHKLILTK